MCCTLLQIVAHNVLHLAAHIPKFRSAPVTSRITGWRRLIGSPKLHIIFYKRATKCRALLRKMTYSDKGSYESSPPCTSYLSMSVCADVCVCASVGVCTYVYKYMHGYIHVRVCVYVNMFIYLFIHIHVQVYTYIFI